MTQLLTGRDAYLAEFQRQSRAGNGRAWVQPLREAAIQRFERLGFPTMRDEQWRQTNLTALIQTAFEPAAPASLKRVPPEHALDGPQLVFVNGHFAPALSTLGDLPRGVTVRTLAEALADATALVQPHLGRLAPHETHAFAALNTALFSDGAFVHVARGVAAERPIHLLFLTIGGRAATVTHPRNLLIVEEAAQASFVETHAGLGGGVYFTNAVTELVVGEGAVARHTKVQREALGAFHIACVSAEQSGASTLVTDTVNIGGALTRSDLGVVLAGEATETALHGLSLVSGRQHVDNHTRLDHARPRCHSRQLYKAVVDDRATSVFNGHILVRPDAQRTDAVQQNRNLLLAETATAHAQPQLEIFADDVRCTHGATVGNIDESAVFYLRARGVAEAEARGMLTCAFANEVVELIAAQPLRERLERLISERFGRRRAQECVP